MQAAVGLLQQHVGPFHVSHSHCEARGGWEAAMFIGLVGWFKRFGWLVA